jgi:hypothetical protein
MPVPAFSAHVRTRCGCEVTFCRFRMTRSANAQHFRCLPFRPAQAGTVRLSSPSLLRSGAPSVDAESALLGAVPQNSSFNFLRTSGQKNRFYVRLNIFNFRFSRSRPCGKVDFKSPSGHIRRSSLTIISYDFFHFFLAQVEEEAFLSWILLHRK